MKTTFVKSVTLAIMLLTSVTSANLFAGNKFVVNYETENDRVTAKIVYKYDGTLHRHIKYNYSYNEEGKVAKKEALKWDSSREKWVPYYINNFTYTNNSFVIDHVVWNTKEKTYNLAKERNVYQMNEENIPVSCVRYKWESEEEKWNYIDQIHYLEPAVLYAESSL